ncbi:sensor histidine kinase [Streptomyces iconiensis]|uniref:histidine kinase n=1 Tax=Streptomyces iconiensis TaxID=1384038 RepID=A0ABT6ZPI0_9ACTN|nr:ATP-binding protein [Streptomyces iconiensis]MDJ1130960.1 ATP-binding protein [Streptomyces iconiensis]
MVRSESSPGGKRSGSIAAWSIPAVVTAAATIVAATTVMPEARTAVIWCGVIATVAVALVTAEAVRRGRALEALRASSSEHIAALQWHLEHQEASTVRLARERLPEAVARLQEGEFAEDVLLSTAAEGQGLSPQFHAAHEALLRSVVEAVQAEENMRDSAQRGVVNIARRVQAIVHQQATDLRGMEDRHGQRPEFFADLLRLDHGTALIGRLADSIAVLGGARPGRQWSKAVPLYSVLRGAMSRIIDYQRVELHSVAEVAVVGPAVEPLIHALAELLDNATRYSPPKARVHLTASEVHMGIAIEIEDGGVGLSEEARARAERMLKEARAGIDLNDLGEAPRLGLAVVGRVAQAYDFQVSLPPSAYGGVRAVLCVPKNLLTTAPASGRAHGIGAASGPRPAPQNGAAQAGSDAALSSGIPAPRSSSDAYAPSTAPAASTARGAAPYTAPGRTDGPAAQPAGGARSRQAPGYAGHAEGTESAEDTEDPIPTVTERTPSGLPQRRRRAPNMPSRTGQGDPRAGAPQPGPAAVASEEPMPGVWMAELQSGLSGAKPKQAPSRGSSDTSDKDD